MKRAGEKIEIDVGHLPLLPKEWKWGRIEDAATKERNAIVDGPFGSNLKLSDYIQPPGVPVLTTANLRGDYGAERVRYISKSKFDELKRSEVRGGDILVAKIGSCGLTGIYPDFLPSAIIPANLLKMTVHPDFSRKFIFYYLNSPIFSGFLKSIITATAQPAFNVSKFRQLPLPLVPRGDQDEIVAEIEKQFTRMETGVAGLRRVQANLKRYRAAVLKAACEGKLVPTEAELARQEGRSYESGAQLLERILTERRQKWNGKGKYKEPTKPVTANLPPLLEGWEWASAEQLTDETRSITYGVIKLGPPVQDGVPILRSSDVRHLKLDLQDVKRIAPDIASRFKRTFLQGSEILVTVRGTLGGVVVVPEDCSGYNISREVAMLALVEPSIAKAVAMFIGSVTLQRWLLERTKGIAYTGINIETLKQLPIPIPPFVEQQRIVAELERRLSVVEEMDAVVNANLQRATRLRQSILQRAFEGELVTRYI